jgi:ankyrin repeat protein
LYKKGQRACVTKANGAFRCAKRLARNKPFLNNPIMEKHPPSHLNPDLLEEAKMAFRADDAVHVRQLLESHPELKALINEPVGPFDTPAIVNAKSRAMVDVLLAAGADINAKSKWWAGGFGLLDSASPEVAAYAIERGAVVDAHAAARLGMLEELRALLAAAPDLVHSRGGDGQAPLHFASSVPIAELLLDRGAEIDARDVDHESTPAQYMVSDRQEVARALIRRGCKTDILMAAALGDADLVRRHLDLDPDCIRMRVTDEFFPMADKRAGGTIYQWTLGFYASAHQVAKKFGHPAILQFLMERSSPEQKLIAACWLGDEATVQALCTSQPDLVARLSEPDRQQVAHAARNNETTAVRLMVEAGLPVDVRGQHQGTALHWAAYHGNAEMVRILLHHGSALETRDANYHATPLGWAIHGSEHGWCPQKGSYGEAVEALLQAGATPPEKVEGSEAVREVLRRHGLTGKD